MYRTEPHTKRTFFILLTICLLIFLLPNLEALNPVIQYLDGIDKSLMLTLNYDGGNTTDAFWSTISKNIAWVPLGVTLILSFAYYRKGILIPIFIIVGLALVVTLCDQIASSLIKPHFERLRPSHNEEICDLLHYVNNNRAGRYGFVSSHAANAFGVFMFLSHSFRHKASVVAMLIWSCMVAYSRIYLGVHYPGDVVCGALLGLTVGLGVSIALRYLYILITGTSSRRVGTSDLRHCIESHPITTVIVGTSLYLLVYSFHKYIPFTFYNFLLY